MKYNNNKISKTIGENLFILRQSLGLKQEAFASELRKTLKTEFMIDSNYDCKTISNWEQGKSIPKQEVLIAISKKYNLCLDELLKEDIKDIVSKTSYSPSEQSLLNNFLDNEKVCIKKNGKYESAFNPELYKYGQLSYLADNLINYRSELSKNFSFTKQTKEVEIIVGIMDVNDGKRELHYLGTGENDIVSVENVPSNYVLHFDKKNKSIINGIMHDEILNKRRKQIIKLGNGKCYYLDDMDISKYDSKDYKFTENNTPNDLDFYEINKDDYDWTDYATLKGHYIIDDNNLFDFYSSGAYYYKNANVFAIVLWGKIKCSDAQLVKVLTDDYRHRLLKALDKISDDSICEVYKKEIDKYEEKKMGDCL